MRRPPPSIMVVMVAQVRSPAPPGPSRGRFAHGSFHQSKDHPRAAPDLGITMGSHGLLAMVPWGKPRRAIAAGRPTRPHCGQAACPQNLPATPTKPDGRSAALPPSGRAGWSQSNRPGCRWSTAKPSWSKPKPLGHAARSKRGQRAVGIAITHPRKAPSVQRPSRPFKVNAPRFRDERPPIAGGVQAVQMSVVVFHRTKVEFVSCRTTRSHRTVCCIRRLGRRHQRQPAW